MDVTSVALHADEAKEIQTKRPIARYREVFM